MRIIALVIGNNNYSDPDKLENAVNDAKSMKDVICLEKKKLILLIKKRHLENIIKVTLFYLVQSTMC
ncbi:MAG: caspase family protein [Prevotellaceae bacterium]|nr:caspase family protein [Prevotellaceae bacterium]